MRHSHRCRSRSRSFGYHPARDTPHSALADNFTHLPPDRGALHRDTIVDNSYVDGNTLNPSALLDPAFSIGQPESDYVRGVQSGSNITIRVDLNGGGNSFVDVAILQNYGTNSADIIRVTFEGTDHVLLV